MRLLQACFLIQVDVTEFLEEQDSLFIHFLCMWSRDKGGGFGFGFFFCLGMLPQLSESFHMAVVKV